VAAAERSDRNYAGPLHCERNFLASNLRIEIDRCGNQESQEATSAYKAKHGAGKGAYEP
jgi:hypothetical protein